MPEEPPAAGYERSDVSARAAAWSGLVLFVSVAVVGWMIWRMEAHLDPTGPAWPHSPNNTDPEFQAPKPMLQSAPTEDLTTLRAEEDKALKSCGWVDRKAGVIRIPLERAMALTLQRGLPVTGTSMPLPGPLTTPPSSQTPVPNQGGTP